MHDVAIVAARRTPIGTAGHGLAGLTAADLAAAVLPPVLTDAGLTADEVAEVVLGNCTGPGGDLARFAALQAGLGVRRTGADRRPAVRQRAGRAGRRGGPGRIGPGRAGSRGDRRWGGVGVHVDQARTGAVRPARLDRRRAGGSGDGGGRRPGGRPSGDQPGPAGRVRAALPPVRRGGGRRGDVRRRARRGRRADRADERPRPGMTRERLARMRPIFSARGDGHGRHVVRDQRRGRCGGPDDRVGPGPARAAGAADPGVGHGRGVARGPQVWASCRPSVLPSTAPG